MRKLIFYVLAAMFFGACASTTNTKVNPYKHITVDNVKASECKAAESWNVSVLGYGAMVIRFDDCLNFKRLLAISANGANLTDDIRKHSLELLSLHYIEYLKRTYPDSTWSIQKINEESLKDGNWIVYFYAIEEKKSKCTSEECKPKE